MLFELRRVLAKPWLASCCSGPVSLTAVVLCALAAFFLATIVFLMFPEVDAAASALFYNGEQFSGRTGRVEAVRDTFKAIYIGALTLALAGVLYSYRRSSGLFGLSSARWLVVASTLVAGPGLVANVLLKNELGRARPMQTELFGGEKMFTPALVRTNQCERNCSFISGEASSIFAVFFAFAMVTGRWARPLFAGGLCFGILAGLIRMAQGAHFLSDVVFAGIFMALTAALMRFVIIDLALPRFVVRDAGGRPAVN